MTTLLIDYNSVVAKYAKKLAPFRDKLDAPPDRARSQSLGLILSITTRELSHLDAIPAGMDRLLYLNEIKFKDYSYSIYDAKAKLCEIIYPNAKSVDFILSKFPNDVAIWAGVDIRNPAEVLDMLTSKNFVHPYICKESPLGYRFPTYGICMYAGASAPVSRESVKLEVIHTLEQFVDSREDNCDIKIKLSPDAIKYLKSLSSSGSSLNLNGTISQKEISGSLGITKVVKIDGMVVYVVDPNNDSIKNGEEETVTISRSLYNFHSHPEEAYIRHSVSNGWPSGTDYLGYLETVLMFQTIFHCVATIEGVYVITMNKQWISKLDAGGSRETPVVKQLKKVVANLFDIDHLEKMSPHEYVETVNHIKYDGKPIFTVYFMPWGRAGDIINIVYPKNGLNCFVSDKSLENFETFHKT